MAGNTLETIFRFVSDKSTMNAAIRDQDRMDEALEKTKRSAESLADSYSDVERSARRTADAQREAAEVAIRAARQQSELYGDTAGRLSAISGLTSGLGGAAFGGRLMLAADILDAVEATKLMKAELPALAAQLGLTTTSIITLGAAAGGLYLAYSKLKDSMKENREEAQKNIELQERVINMKLYGQTTEQIQEQMAAISESLKIRARLIYALEDEAEAHQESLNAFQVAGDKIGILNEGMDNFSEKIKELTREQEIELLLYDELVAALDTTAVAYQDRIALEKQLAEEVASQREKLYGTFTEIFTLADEGTTEQVDSRIESLKREQVALQASGYWAEEAGKARYDEIDDMIDWLEQIRPTIEAREAETDATKAAEEAEKALEAARLSAIQNTYNRFQLIIDAAADWDEGQLDSRIESLEREKRALVVSGAFLEDAGKARLDEINKTIEWLEKIRPTIIARQEEADAVAEQEAAYEAAVAAMKRHSEMLAQIAEDREAVTDAFQAIQAATAEFANETRQIAAEREREAIEEQADFALQRTRDLADHYADMAELDRSYYEQRNQTLADIAESLADIEDSRIEQASELNEDLEDMAEAHGKRMLQIRENADTAIRSAALRLDAIAIYEARQRAEQEIEDEQEQYEEQQEERERAYQEALDLLEEERRDRIAAGRQQLRDLEVQHRQERSAREADFRERLRREDEDRAIRLQRQQEAYRREDSERQLAFNRQLLALQGHHRNTEAQLQQHYDQLFEISRGGLARIRAEAAASTPTSIGPSLSLLGGLPSFAEGGYVPGGIIRSHPGEFMLDRQTTRIAERGLGQRLTQSNLRQLISQPTFHSGDLIVNTPTSMTPGQLKNVFDRWFNQKMEQMRR